MSTNTFAPDPQRKARPYSLPVLDRKSRVVVVGAGAFGGWSALHLLRAGLHVTLVDAWGPGNSRSSSGDETRVIRSTYGGNETYFNLNVRALELWKENEIRFGKQCFYQTGVLWFCYNASTPIVDDSIPFTRHHQQEYEYLSPDELSRRYPLINTSDLHHAVYDPFGGYLKAREATQHVTEAFIKEGGAFIQAQVVQQPQNVEQLSSVTLHDGTELSGDIFIFACGSWLGKLFPGVLDRVITCTRQEVYYFGVPATHAKQFDEMPVWIDVDGHDFYYGIPGNAMRGFKLGVDERGELFDPTSGERVSNPEVLSKARAFMTHRFPLLKNAPLVESRVCPYENSPDGNFIFDKHPQNDRIIFLGGGSGHGFKHGPAWGELVADVLTGKRTSPTLFQLPD